MRRLNLYESSLCDLTGRVFWIAKEKNLDLPEFIEGFLNCEVSKLMDSDCYSIGGCGPYYMFEMAQDEIMAKTSVDGNKLWGRSAVEWAGWMYRVWNYLTGEISSSICKMCPPRTMLSLWFVGHTIDPELFIEDVKSGMLK